MDSNDQNITNTPEAPKKKGRGPEKNSRDNPKPISGKAINSYIKRKLTEEEELFLSAEPDKQTLQQQRAELFMKHFVDTKGNATEAAVRAFGVLNRAVAARMGSFYIGKIREAGRMYLEDQGITYGTFIDTVLNRAKTEKDPEYLRMLARIMGPEISEIVAPQPKSNNQQNVNVNILQDYRKTQDEFGFGDIGEEEMEGEIIEDNG